MKKTLSILVISTIMLSVFFCVPVFADTVNIPAVMTARKEVTNPPFAIIATLARLNLEREDDANINDPSYTYEGIKYQLSVIITNYSDEVLFLENVRLRFNTNDSYSDSSIITDIVNQSPDLYFAFKTDSTLLSICGYIDYGFEASGFRVPPKQTISAVCTISTNTYLNGSTVVQRPITSFEIYNTFNYRISPVYPNGSNKPIWDKLQEIINAIKGNNTTNTDVSNNSDILANQSDQIHSQEASYYAQNNQAIQATGLSNYQFDNTTVSGLQGVRGDFIDVWNSLSGWNAVYIFSLTLGLALTILRHSPSAISSAIRRRSANNGGNGH